MTNVANNTLVYKAVAKGLAMLGDQIDKDNRKLIQMLASLDKLQIKLSKGPAGFKQLAKAEKEVDAATQAYAQALHARAAAEQKRTELKKLLDTQLRQNLERDRGDQSVLRKDPYRPGKRAGKTERLRTIRPSRTMCGKRLSTIMCFMKNKPCRRAPRAR